MTTPLDPATLRVLIAEIERADAPTWMYDLDHVAGLMSKWLQAKLDALPKEPGATCWICAKEKGQPPDRCPGHYEQPPAPRIPPDLASALREWRVWVKERSVGYSSDRMLAAAIDAALAKGDL